MFTRGKVHDFLSAHTAYELIPESGKVVVLDVELPVRQAFHALHEQSIASAPLWDPRCGTLCMSHVLCWENASVQVAIAARAWEAAGCCVMLNNGFFVRMHIQCCCVPST